MKRLLAILFLLTLVLGAVACDAPEPPKDQRYVFRKGTVEISIDAEASGILSQLGTYKTYDATPSCAFAGEDKIYVYDGFKLQTYQKVAGGEDYVYSVVLTDDSHSTPEGITIGSSAAAVLEAYGNPDERTETMISYTTKTETLLFLIKEEKVSSIQYLKLI